MGTNVIKMILRSVGIMSAFDTIHQFEKYLDEILDLIEDFNSTAQVSLVDLNALESGSESRTNSTSINVSLSIDPSTVKHTDEEIIMEPIHIMHVGFKDKGDTDDSSISRFLGKICKKYKDELDKRGEFEKFKGVETAP